MYESNANPSSIFPISIFIAFSLICFVLFIQPSEINDEEPLKESAQKIQTLFFATGLNNKHNISNVTVHTDKNAVIAGYTISIKPESFHLIEAHNPHNINLNSCAENLKTKLYDCSYVLNKHVGELLYNFHKYEVAGVVLPMFESDNPQLAKNLSAQEGVETIFSFYNTSDKTERITTLCAKYRINKNNCY